MQQKSKENFGSVVSGLTIVAYFILLFTLEIPPALKYLQPVGLVLFAAGIIFIALAISTLLRNHTETVTRRGVFAIVRNPLYLGAMFLFLSMAFFLPHWIMVLLSVVNILILYWFMVVEEQKNLEKFGESYAQYMQVVPRANFIIGFIRLLRRK